MKALKFYSVNLIRISKTFATIFMIVLVKRMSNELKSYTMLRTDTAYGSKNNSFNDPTVLIENLSNRNHSLYDLG